MARTTATKTSSKTASKKSASNVADKDGYPVYDPAADRDAYKKGDVVFFPKVRNWLAKGNLVEAYGRVINVQLFEGEAPYIEVSFDDQKKQNGIDLGKDIRKFLLEVRP
jgi:hypothetical protein